MTPPSTTPNPSNTTSPPETTTTTTFTHLPTLSLASSLSPTTKPAFLASLRHALLHTGFLYLTSIHDFIPAPLLARVIAHTHAFFTSLPLSAKLDIEMKKAPSFLGYSRPGMETTAGMPDQREQLDLATPHFYPIPGSEAGAAVWRNLWGPNQWPVEAGEGVGGDMAGFRATMEEYMARMGELAQYFTTLIAEALDLAPDAFDRFFDTPVPGEEGTGQGHKLKLVKYPEASATEAGERGQGVGPHKDSMLSSFLLQASSQPGLQAQNPTTGAWIPIPAVPGTLVVALGQGLEALTSGICTSTTHRVLSPLPGEGPRYSVPFFQGVSFEAEFEGVGVGEGVREEKARAVESAGMGGRKGNEVEFTFVKGRWLNLGEATLMNRVKSHPDVGERWYPELLAQIRAQQAQEAKDKQKDKLSEQRDTHTTTDTASTPPPAAAMADSQQQKQQTVRAH